MKIKELLNKIKKALKKNYKWIIFLICIICFLEIAEDVLGQEIMKRDVIGYKYVSKYLINDNITPIVKCITQLGNAGLLIIIDFILSIIFWVKNKKNISIEMTLNLIFISCLNLILKNIVQRPRPTEYRIINEIGYSFPSGHSMISMAFYGFFIYLIFKNVKNKYLKWTSIALLSLLILSIGISRIYLGVHYTSDVLAGFFISIAYLCCYTELINKFNKRI